MDADTINLLAFDSFVLADRMVKNGKEYCFTTGHHPHHLESESVIGGNLIAVRLERDEKGFVLTFFIAGENVSPKRWAEYIEENKK